MNKRLAISAFGLLAAVLFVGWFAGSQGSPTIAAIANTINCEDCNVIFISLTNVRADHLSVYGYERETSANIDRLASKSLVFEQARTVASWTLPVIMSVYTSTFPIQHQVMNRYPVENASRVSLPEESYTILDTLHDAGYMTAAFTSRGDYDERYGLTTRFQHHEYFPSEGTGAAYGSMKNASAASIDWLEKNKDEKFFIHVHGYDAHCPFARPQENDVFDPDYEGVDFNTCYWTFDKVEPISVGSKSYYVVKQSGGATAIPPKLSDRDIYHMKALYDGEIMLADQYVGTLLDRIEELGLSENTIIVFFSEHGDLFGEHGRFMRGGALRGSFYDDVMHVPLIIKHPRLAPKKISHLTSLIDLGPTVLSWLGLPGRNDFEGVNLLEARDSVFAATKFVPPPTNSYFNRSSTIMAVWQDNAKLIKEEVVDETSYEVYDLEKDPEEREHDPEKLTLLNQTLHDWMRGLR